MSISRFFFINLKFTESLSAAFFDTHRGLKTFLLLHSQVSNKQRKEQQRQEKKKRQEERHRQKFLQGKGGQDQNQNLPEAVTLVPALNTLSI